MTVRPRSLPAILAVACALALGLSACSSDPADPEPSPKRGEAADLQQVSPLTGLAMDDAPDHPAFMVKIENTSSGEPQLGLDQADLVAEELVEGGLTRLAAFYYSELPGKVGHVRSLRGTDAGIASPVGATLVASGGAGGAVRKIKRAGIELMSEDAGAPGFSSDPSLSRPYNRLVDLTRIAKKADGGAPSKPVMSFGGGAEPGSSKVTSASEVSVRFSPSTTTQWKRSGKQWKRTNGHAKKEFAADNLIVMYCDVEDAGYTDPAGNPVPETVVEGTGRAMLIRGGRAVELDWSKPKLDSSIAFTTADGKPYPIAPGKTYLSLVPDGDGDVTVK